MQLTWQQAIGIDESHLESFCDSRHENLLVHAELVKPLQELLEQAERDKVAIKVVSSYRGFARQLAIWNDKWQGFRPVFSRHGRPLNVNQMSDIEKYKAICLWSAIPGLSRHHWGTDFDIFSADAIENGHRVELVPEEFSPQGPCAELQNWLNINLTKFKFFRPYRQFQQGVCEEPWHVSYYPVSTSILENFEYSRWSEYIQDSGIKAARFIGEQLEHYKEKYFCNICELDLDESPL